eukprot:3781015-Ditylum_brightwellii.AAC.1
MVDESIFNKNADWTDFYADVEEEPPPRMPAPRGNWMSIHTFVDANRACSVVTKRLHIGIIIFVHNAPIIWFSKYQNTVESATFGRCGQEHQRTIVNLAEEAQCNYLSCSSRRSYSWHPMCKKEGWLNQPFQPTDKGCGGGKEMGAMLANYV